MGWLKSIWNSLKKGAIESAIDALDNTEPILAKEIDSLKSRIQQMNSTDVAKILIDRLQDYLRTYFDTNPKGGMTR